MKKGYFPLLYNTGENQDTIFDGLSDQKYYDPDGMNKDKREEIYEMVWNEQRQNLQISERNEGLLHQWCRYLIEGLLEI